MNFPVIFRMLGFILCGNGLFMTLSLIVALLSGGNDSSAFIFSILCCIIPGIPLSLIKPSNTQYYAKDGFMTVALCWVFLSITGALPYFFAGYGNDYTSALFEAASGFTTTGATIFSDVESLSTGILFWRGLTHWLGSMGVLVLTLAVIPASIGSGGSALFLMRAESSGPDPGRMMPSMRQTATKLYVVYLIITIACFLSLMLTGMPAFDSLMHTFATVATGGFSTLNNSIGQYNSLGAEIVITVFMLLSTFNYGVYFALSNGDKKSIQTIFKNTEFKALLLIISASVAAIAINLMPYYGGSFFTALRHGSFQAVSIMSTTGFSTANYNLWPEFSQAILIFLMFIGGCAGSTSGGVKVIRIAVALKAVRREINKVVHPRQIKGIKIDGRTINEDIVYGICVFIVTYIAMLFGSTIVVMLTDNFDFMTVFTSVLSSLSNVGSSFGRISNGVSYDAYSPLGKIILTFCMLAGRLELYPLLILLSPATYKRGR